MLRSDGITSFRLSSATVVASVSCMPTRFRLGGAGPRLEGKRWLYSLTTDDGYAAPGPGEKRDAAAAHVC